MTASCISRQQSAANWAMPPALPDGTCPDISGHFQNIGQSPDANGQAFLSCELLNPKSSTCSSTGPNQASQVAIEKVGSSWRITGTGGEDPPGPVSRALSKGDFQCRNGWLTIKTTGAKGLSSSGAGFSTTSRSFAVSNGFLLERKKMHGVVFFLIAPVAGSSTLWYRYPLVDGAKEQP